MKQSICKSPATSTGPELQPQRYKAGQYFESDCVGNNSIIKTTHKTTHATSRGTWWNLPGSLPVFRWRSLGTRLSESASDLLYTPCCSQKVIYVYPCTLPYNYQPSMKALVNTCIQAHHLWTLLLVYELKMWSVTVSLHMSFAISTVCLFCKLMCFRVAHSCSVTCTCTNDECCCLHQLITDDRESKNRLKWRSLIRVWINMCDSVTLSPLSNQAMKNGIYPGLLSPLNKPQS